MKKLISSKKGWKTAATIVAMFLLVLIFIIFIIIFTNVEKGPAKETKMQFLAVEKEMILGTFLNTPTELPPAELGLDMGSQATNADIIVMNCDEAERSKGAFKLMAQGADTYFKRLYDDDWGLELNYYDFKDKTKTIGIERIGYIKSKGNDVYSQILPCKNREHFVKIYLVLKPKAEGILPGFVFKD